MATLKTAAELASNSPLKTALELALEGRPLTRGQQELLQKNREVVNKLLSAEPEDFLSRVEVRAGGQRPIKVAPNSRAHTRTYNKMMDLIDSGEWDEMTASERKVWTDKTFKEEVAKISGETEPKASAKAEQPKAPAEADQPKASAKPKGYKQGMEQGQQAGQRATQAVQDASDSAKKAARKAAEEVAEGAATNTGRVAGFLKGAKPIANKVAKASGAVGAVLAAKDLYDLTDEEERQRVEDQFANYDDDTYFSGEAAIDSVTSPVDVAYGNISAIGDIIDSKFGENVKVDADKGREAATSRRLEARAMMTPEQRDAYDAKFAAAAARRKERNDRNAAERKALEERRATVDAVPTGDSFNFAAPPAAEPAAAATAAAEPAAPTPEELKAVAGDNQDMFGTGPAAVDVSGDRKAEVISEDPEDYTDKAIEIFKDLHATEFDPKSRMDRGKLEKMKSMLADVGGIGDEEGAVNKFALQFYRNS